MGAKKRPPKRSKAVTYDAEYKRQIDEELHRLKEAHSADMAIREAFFKLCQSASRVLDGLQADPPKLYVMLVAGRISAAFSDSAQASSALINEPHASLQELRRSPERPYFYTPA